MLLQIGFGANPLAAVPAVALVGAEPLQQGRRVRFLGHGGRPSSVRQPQLLADALDRPVEPHAQAVGAAADLGGDL